MPNDNSPHPPIGDSKDAPNYISKLIAAFESERYTLVHSDLSKFDPCSIQDHYRVDLGDYHAEVSHSKHPQTAADVYSLIFTNIQKIRDGASNEAVLSYISLEKATFDHFKSAAERYFKDGERRAELRRFKEAMSPVDAILSPFNETTSSKEKKEDTEVANPQKEDTPKKTESFDELFPSSLQDQS